MLTEDIKYKTMKLALNFRILPLSIRSKAWVDMMKRKAWITQAD